MFSYKYPQSPSGIQIKHEPMAFTRELSVVEVLMKEHLYGNDI